MRDVIHAFNQRGLDALDPRWAGGRPRRISAEDEAFIVQAATTRPERLGRPFTHWSIRKLAGYLADNPVRIVAVGRERLRQLLCRHKISFQRTRTWKESRDPGREAKLDRIEQVTGVIRRREGADHTLAALRSIRAARPDGEQLHVILDNLSANKTPAIRRWAKRNQVELCFTPTSASWANPIEAQFGPVRSFVLGDSDHPNHTVLARKLQSYLRSRNANARHPGVLAAQRRERARIRSQRQHRWGRPRPKAA